MKPPLKRKTMCFNYEATTKEGKTCKEKISPETDIKVSLNPENIRNRF